MNYYVIGEDKSLKAALTEEEVEELIGQGFLPLAGGVMTGNIGYQGTNYLSRNMIRFIDNTVDAYGNGIGIGDAGVVIIGAGECTSDITNNVVNTNGNQNGGQETLYLASDNAIVFYTNAQNGIANAKKVTLNNGLMSGHQKAITSGTAAPSGGSNGDIYIQY